MPKGADYWPFDCKFGVSENVAEVVHLSTARLGPKALRAAGPVCWQVACKTAQHLILKKISL